MTNFPKWLYLPWLIVFIWLMLWTPKSKKGWYTAFCVIACQVVVLIYLHYSK